MDAKEQAIENLITAAKTIIEEIRADMHQNGDYMGEPDWLEDLERAVDEIEML